METTMHATRRTWCEEEKDRPQVPAVSLHEFGDFMDLRIKHEGNEMSVFVSHEDTQALLDGIIQAFDLNNITPSTQDS
jgi:hypothetical protein